MQSKNMAGFNQDSDIGIENLVRRIINSVREVPNTVAGPSQQHSGGQGTNDLHVTAEEELNHRFRIPRGETGQTQQTLSLNRNSDSGNLGRQYNPSENYGYGNGSRRTRQSTPYRRNQRSTSLSTNRATRNLSNTSAATSRAVSITVKEVILLMSPRETNVPKYSKKVGLHKNGLIIDAVEIDRNWSEKQLREKLEALFSDKLKGIGFDFAKAIGHNLILIRLPKQTELSGKILLGIVKQGPIYIMPQLTLDLCNDEDDDCWSNSPGQDEEQGNINDDVTVVASRQHSSKDNTIVPFLVRDSDGQSNEGPSNEQGAIQDTCINQLVLMFPHMSKDQLIIEYHSSGCDINKTISTILGDDNETDQDMAEDMPLTISQNTPSQAMSTFQNRVVDGTAIEQQIVASHDSSVILRTMFRLLKHGNFNIRAKPNVIFADEPGIDAEGLTRELCHMVMASLRDGKGNIILFEGSIGHLIPVHNEQYIASKYFEYAGKLIAHSVIHAGFGLVGVSRAIVEYLVEDDLDKCLTHLSVEDIPDFDIQSTIKELQEPKKEDVLNEIVGRENVSLLLAQAGFTNELVTMTNKHRACQCIIVHMVVKTRLEELQQLRIGMESISVLQFLQLCHGCVKFVFPSVDDVSLKASDVLSFLEQDMLQNLSGVQEMVVNWFIQYIKEVGENSEDTGVDHSNIQVPTDSVLCGLPTLKQVVQFIAGHPYVPSAKLNITFAAGSSTAIYPDADSCFYTLQLPVCHTNYEEFRKAMNTAISCQYEGYGRG